MFTVLGRGSWRTPSSLTPRPRPPHCRKQAHAHVPGWTLSPSPGPQQALSSQTQGLPLFSAIHTFPSLPDQAARPPSRRFSRPRLPKGLTFLITQPIRGLLSTLCLPIKGKNSELPKGLPPEWGPPE